MFVICQTLTFANLCRWSTAQNTWMNQASKLDVWDMARGAVDPFEVPDGLGSESHDQSQESFDCRIMSRGGLEGGCSRGRIDFI
jgi:hypothetical protein